MSETIERPSDDEHRMHDWTDEVGFRVGVPESVAMFRVLEVRRFKAGSEEDGRLPRAVALSRFGRTEEWATHVIEHDPDNAQYPWALYRPHYFSDLDKARANLEKRWP